MQVGFSFVAPFVTMDESFDSNSFVTGTLIAKRKGLELPGYANTGILGLLR